MNAQHAKSKREKRQLRRDRNLIADERGWAGQHGQSPANSEERNYRPHEQQAHPNAPAH